MTQVDLLQLFNAINRFIDKYSWAICGMTFAFVVAVLILDRIKTSKKKKHKLKELKKARPGKAHGIIFGKKRGKVIYSPAENEGSVGVFSASGTGKTSAVGIPTLQGWTGTSYTIDISGDICKNCPNMPNKLIYEPENPNTTAYNIFGSIDELDDRNDRNEALEQLAFLLIPGNATNDNAKFFQDNGRKILTASLIAFYGAGMDFIEICEKIVGSGWKDLFRAIDDTENKAAMMYINSFEGASEQNTAGCKQACDDALKLFATNAKVKKSIHRPKRE